MERKKQIIIIFVSVVLVLALVLGCAVFLQDKPGQDSGASEASVSASIRFSDNHAEVSGAGASVKDTKVTITQAGSYEISGSSSNGRVCVEAGENDEIKLILNNLSLTCPDNETIHIKQAGNTVLELKEGTENAISSGEVPESVTGGDNIFSQKDLSENAVVSELRTGENASKAAIYAKTRLLVTGRGKLTVYGFLNNGIQSKDALSINGGVLRILACNHGVKGENSLSSENSDITVIAGNDGMHTTNQLVVSGGSVNVLYSNEGIEGNQIAINAGTVDVTAMDDGMNASGENPCLSIAGGDVFVHADGDGLDSNGDIRISGGNVVVDGPTNDGNGGLDSGQESGGVCEITGGTVFVTGSSGMAEGFAESSGQCSFLYNSETHWEAGTKINILDENQEVLYEYTTKKTANSLVFSSPKLSKGKSYTIRITDSAGSVSEEEISQDSISVSAGEASRFGGRMGHPGNGGFGNRPDKGQMPDDGKRPDQGQMPGDGNHPDFGQRPDNENQPDAGEPPAMPSEKSGE